MMVDKSPSRRSASRVFFFLALVVIGALVTLWLRNPDMMPQATGTSGRTGKDLVLDERCAMYRTSIENKLGQRHFYAKRSRASGNYALNKIFYSPRTQSCLYVTMATLFKQGEIHSMVLNLTNASDHELIHSTWLYWGDDDFEAEKGRFENVVAQYEQLEAPTSP